MTLEDMNTISNDIDEFQRRFVDILKPNDGVRTIQFQLKKGRRRPLRSSCQEKIFPNSNNFNLNGLVNLLDVPQYY